MRDLVLNLISKSLVRWLKTQKDVEPAVQRLLPSENLYSDTREHVRTYKAYLDDFKH